MLKSRKQKTAVKKKRMPSTRRKKIGGSLLEPTVEAVDDTILAAFAAVEFDSISSNGKNQLTVTESVPKLGTRQVGSSTEKRESKMEDYTDVSEEKASIISIVKDLEEQVETAFKLNEVLEAELYAAQKKLSEESTARARLEVQANSLEGQAAMADQLREDISFAEEERNKFAKLLAKTQPQLEAVTGERDSLIREVTSAKARTKELESDKMALEAQVMNLRDKVVDIDRLHIEFDKVNEARCDLSEQVHDLSSCLEASDMLKSALEKELDGLHEEVEDFQKKFMKADGRAVDLRAQLENQRDTNRALMEVKARLESETKMLNAGNKAAKKELEAFKKALRDIRSEATRTSGRVRQRYFKPKKNKK